MVSGADAIRLWDLPEAPVPAPTWFIQFAEAVSGLRRGLCGDLELAARREFQEILAQSTDPSADAFYLRLARWFIADPQERAASPFVDQAKK